MWYKMIVIFESGKKLTYEKKNKLDLIIMRERIKENEERRAKLGMAIDRAIKFEMTVA